MISESQSKMLRHRGISTLERAVFEVWRDMQREENRFPTAHEVSKRCAITPTYAARIKRKLYEVGLLRRITDRVYVINDQWRDTLQRLIIYNPRNAKRLIDSREVAAMAKRIDAEGKFPSCAEIAERLHVSETLIMRRRKEMINAGTWPKLQHTNRHVNYWISRNLKDIRVYRDNA